MNAENAINMRIIFIGIALFTFVSPAHAQNDEFAHLGNAHGRYTFWWLSSPAAVRDSMKLDPGWEPADFEAKRENMLGYASKDLKSARFFAFSEGLLIKQSYLTSPGTSEYDKMIGWFYRTVALVDGSRLDRNSGLILKKFDAKEGIMFTIEPDWDDEQAIKLSK